MAFPIPKGLSKEDEGRHAVPQGAEGRLFSDTLWVSMVDPKANIFGVNHIHLTAKGYARFQAVFFIDGTLQAYGNKVPLDPEPDAGPFTDGNMTYEVIDPFEHLRISLDSDRFGFSLDFKARFPVFDYADCLAGDPLATATPFHRGHFEQGLQVNGDFEIRGGPSKGEVRQIDCWSHRDHTWSDRYSDTPAWKVEENHIPVHYWPSIQTEDKHINGFGLYPENPKDVEKKTWGGFVSTKDGNRPIKNVTAEIEPRTGPGTRAAKSFRYEFTMPDDEVIHVRSTHNYGVLKLWKRAENDVENRLDCYEAFLDWEIEETGETGTGVAEYSVWPVWPQWQL